MDEHGKAVDGSPGARRNFLMLGSGAATIAALALAPSTANAAVPDSVATIADLQALTPGTARVAVEVRGRNQDGDDGGGLFYWDNASTALEDGGTVFKANGITTGRWRRVHDGSEVHVAWFGAFGGWSGTAGSGPDDATGIQKAIDIANSAGAAKITAVFAATRYRIATPLKLRTAVCLRGAGPMDGGTILAADLQGVSASTYAVTAGGGYNPLLDGPPVLFNPNSINWLSIENLAIEGSNTAVYGLWLFQNFYISIRNVRISKCGRRPYVNIRGQVVAHEKLVIYDNDAGALTLDTTAVSFNCCGFERNDQTDYYLQIRQPSPFAKGTTFLSSCWFEGATSFSEPSGGYLGVGGRGVTARGILVNSTTNTANGVVCLGSGSITQDGIIASATSPAMGSLIEAINYPSGARTVLENGAAGCVLQGFLMGTGIVNNSGNETNQVLLCGSGIDFPYALDRFQVRQGVPSGSSGLPLGADSNFMLDVQDGLIRMFGTNNKLELQDGKLALASGTTLRLLSSSANGQHVVIANQALQSTYLSGHIVMGPVHLWVDAAGDLRVKNGAPASDTDGRVL